MDYNPQKIEKKWQDAWEKSGAFETKEKLNKPKFYCLDMFPYPSGTGLHVGHPRGYTATDIISRYKRMKGYNVLHPMGWDAFGLPAENYAIKNQIDVRKAVRENIETFKKEIKEIGLSYDWSREINTTDPEYYKWTQWIFLQLFKKGLAYESMLPINWCPSCKTGLANEEVVGGECERCGSRVSRKNVRQWVLGITQYADRLLNDLEDLDWPEEIKEMQKNWIGRSEGADIEFRILNRKKERIGEIRVFTTRPDTLFGATFLVLAPEHRLVGEVKQKSDNCEEVEKYIERSRLKSDLERTDLAKEKSGIELKGFYAVNPADGSEIPIWIADYVLSSYGYGGIMSVPAHDERDYQFARKYGLPIREVISGGEIPYLGEGKLINSGSFNGFDSEKARKEIVNSLKKKKAAEEAVNYKLRDWIFSRQRYWGEPIPVVHCQKCGVVALPEEELPLQLPEVENYQPTGTGESPLAKIKKWVNIKCPQCGGPAKRETNTMPQWAGSCWYYLRFIDPKNKTRLVDFEKEKKFMPVDLYVGGAEHAVLHLLYARFWHKFLYDIGIVSTKEPFKELKNLGLILAQGGQKMSKSKGNAVSPGEIIKEYGADSFRLYQMFIGPFENAAEWNLRGIVGIRRFLEKVWLVGNNVSGDSSAERSRELHRTVKKVTEDIENFKFNTAVSALMILINDWKEQGASKEEFLVFLKILYPFAPHISEELREILGEKNNLLSFGWPDFDSGMIEEENAAIIIQVNGKTRDILETERGLNWEKVKGIVLEREKVKRWIEKKEIKKVIFVRDKLINIVV